MPSRDHAEINCDRRRAPPSTGGSGAFLQKLHGRAAAFSFEYVFVVGRFALRGRAVASLMALAGASACGKDAVPPPLSRAAPIYDVRDFGAIPDDGLDDGPAIQRAVETGRRVDGAQILVPPGRYDVQQANGVVLRDTRGLMLLGTGATFALSKGAKFGLKLEGSNDGLTVVGLRVLGDGETDSTGIGTASPAPDAAGSIVRILGCEISRTQRGIVFDVRRLEDFRHVVVEDCRIHDIGFGPHGGESGHGNGIALSGVAFAHVRHMTVARTWRHGIYVSVSREVVVEENTVRENRVQSPVEHEQFGGIEVARSSAVDVRDNVVVGCWHGAISIEPHETDPGHSCSGIRILDNRVVDSRDQDVIVGGPGPTTSSLLSDVVVSGNVFRRPSSATNGVESIRVVHGTRIVITGNDFLADNHYVVPWTAIVIGSFGPTATVPPRLDSLTIEHNTGTLSAGPNGSVVFAAFAGTAVAAEVMSIRIVDNQPNWTGSHAMTAFRPAWP